MKKEHQTILISIGIITILLTSFLIVWETDMFRLKLRRCLQRAEKAMEHYLNKDIQSLWYKNIMENGIQRPKDFIDAEESIIYKEYSSYKKSIDRCFDKYGE